MPPEAIDQRQHVNNLVYLQWCLDAAERHWQRNASESIRQMYVWYVLNHHIDYHAPAFEGQNLTIRTWVSTAEGVRSERSYEILETESGKKLVSATTLWCLLKAQTQRPTPITDQIRTLFWK